MLQPILPIFFAVQFNFLRVGGVAFLDARRGRTVGAPRTVPRRAPGEASLGPHDPRYEGWRNEAALDLKAGLAIGGLGLLLLVVAAGAVGDAAVLLPFGLEGLFGAEVFTGITETISSILPSVDGLL